MKIIDSRNNTIFGELNLGDIFIFKFQDVESVYMKTTEAEDCNCVNLTSGRLACASCDDYVIVVNATLVLE